MSKNIAVIFAGGSGLRMGNSGRPKQFLEINGIPIIVYTLLFFQNHRLIDEIYISCLEGWCEHLNNKVILFGLDKVKKIVPGGATGQESIYNALEAAKENNEDDDIVLIHDGVRPFITSELISRNIESVHEYGTGITYTPCFETIIISNDSEEIKNIPVRKETFAAQAPQSFRLGEIINAHKTVRRDNPVYEDIVDSCTLFHSLGKPVHLVLGNRGNIKITTPEDFFMFKALLEYQQNADIIGI